MSESWASRTELSTEAGDRSGQRDAEVSRVVFPPRTCPHLSVSTQRQVVDPALVLPHLGSQLSLELLTLLAPQFPDLEGAHTVCADERDPAGPFAQRDIDLVGGDAVRELSQQRVGREYFDRSGMCLEREETREWSQGPCGRGRRSLSRGWTLDLVDARYEGRKVKRVERGEVPHPDVLVGRGGHEHAQVWNDVDGFDKVEVADGRREERFGLRGSGGPGQGGGNRFRSSPHSRDTHLDVPDPETLVP